MHVHGHGECLALPPDDKEHVEAHVISLCTSKAPTFFIGVYHSFSAAQVDVLSMVVLPWPVNKRCPPGMGF